MDGATVKCEHVEKTGQHKFAPAGSAILQRGPGIIQPLVFGICECGFSIGSTPYVEGATTVEQQEEVKENGKRVVLPFGKGGKA